MSERMTPRMSDRQTNAKIREKKDWKDQRILESSRTRHLSIVTRNGIKYKLLLRKYRESSILLCVCIIGFCWLATLSHNPPLMVQPEQWITKSMTTWTLGLVEPCSSRLRPIASDLCTLSSLIRSRISIGKLQYLVFGRKTLDRMSHLQSGCRNMYNVFVCACVRVVSLAANILAIRKSVALTY